MTIIAVIILVALVGLLSSLAVLGLRRRAKQLRRLPAPDRGPELLDLSLNDVLDMEGHSYLIIGKISHADGGETFVEYRLDEGQTERWLRVVRGDPLTLSLFEGIEAANRRTGDPTLTHAAMTFNLVRRGQSRVVCEGQTRRSGGRCRTFDYEAADGSVLSTQSWGEARVWLVGHRLAAGDIDVLPGDRVERGD